VPAANNAANGVLLVSGTALPGDNIFNLPGGIENAIMGNGAADANTAGNAGGLALSGVPTSGETSFNGAFGCAAQPVAGSCTGF